MEHDWRKKHYSKPTWCAVCSKFIWGLGKQGFVCRGTRERPNDPLTVRAIVSESERAAAAAAHALASHRARCVALEMYHHFCDYYPFLLRTIRSLLLPHTCANAHTPAYIATRALP